MQDRKSGGKVKRWVGGCPWVGDDGGVEWGGGRKTGAGTLGGPMKRTTRQ